MIYTASTSHLWPRLIHAARAQDEDLTAVFTGLLAQRAALTLNQTGGLQLGPGEMGSEAYQQVKAEHLAPRTDAVKAVFRAARDSDHPWFASVRDAFTAMSRAAEGGESLYSRVTTDQERLRHAGNLLQLHAEAVLLANALYLAGYDVGKELDIHSTGAISAANRCRTLGLPAPEESRFIPLQTPDGWLRVTDALEAAQEPGSLTVTDEELGTILGRLDAQRMREAG